MSEVKEERAVRYKRTSDEFKMWLKDEPRADLKRQVMAFNVIADNNYKRANKSKIRKAVSRV